MSKFDPYEHLKVVLNPNGTLTRHMSAPKMPAIGDDQLLPGQSVVSKDVILNPDKKTSLRIFRPTKLPSNDNSIAKLPILIYFHAGGWINFNVADVMVHEVCNKVSNEVPSIVIAVDFRLAPESRLPAQYEDAMDAIQWTKKQALTPDGDQWLRDYSDFSRCYLYGDSCGANIAYNAALRAVDVNIDPMRIVGLVLNQPFIGGKQRTKSELKLAADLYFPLPVIDLLWELALPKGIDRDHRFCNPMADHGLYKDKMKSIGRCLVIGFGGDPLIDRQQEFVQMLVKRGVLVEARFDDVGFHGIDMIDPRRASAILNFVKEFVS